MVHYHSNIIAWRFFSFSLIFLFINFLRMFYNIVVVQASYMILCKYGLVFIFMFGSDLKIFGQKGAGMELLSKRLYSGNKLKFLPSIAPDLLYILPYAFKKITNCRFQIVHYFILLKFYWHNGSNLFFAIVSYISSPTCFYYARISCVRVSRANFPLRSYSHSQLTCFKFQFSADLKSRPKLER